MNKFNKEIITLVQNIKLINNDFKPKAQHALDNKTKPVGSLGQLEEMALTCALVQNTLKPAITKKCAMVFAADHGIAREGVSAYPPEVTYLMVINFLNGGAAINTIADAIGARFAIVDMGVNADFDKESQIISKKIAKGTANFAVGPAMSEEQAILAIEKGIEAFLEVYAKEPMQGVSIGEMGIGNTSSAAAITSAICGLDVVALTGRGTGVDDAGLTHKQKVLKNAMALHIPNSSDAIDILSKVGGFEIAGMCGAMLAAASKGVVVFVDGYISTSAALLAELICPAVTSYFISGHKSVEVGHLAALKKLGLRPVLDLQMRLGEGTGAALTMDLCATACHLMSHMASFDDAGIVREK